jgi:N-acetylglucosaminyldiphosphoundecaprenol N-acetyl-beta-D-mannosaminyltransferase
VTEPHEISNFVAAAPASAGGSSEERVRARVLGCPVDVVDMSTAVARLVGFVEQRRSGGGAAPAVVVTLNPEMVMRRRRDPSFRANVEAAALLVPDGVGIVRALRRRGHREAGRVGGADLLEAYLPVAAARGHRLALAGGAPGVAVAAAKQLLARQPSLIIVAADGGRPDAALARRLQHAAPEMVWAAFGAGAQEEFLTRYLGEIGAAAGIGVGGSLDYVAGRVRRAPAWVRAAGLEWAWRLARQPWRIRRQAVLPVYWWLERREAAQRQQPRAAGRAGQPR